jgi:hypothetical protein
VGVVKKRGVGKMTIINQTDDVVTAEIVFVPINADELALDMYHCATLLGGAIVHKAALRSLLGYIRAIADVAERMADGATVLRGTDRKGRIFYAYQ